MEKYSRRKLIEASATYLSIEDQELINEIIREFQHITDTYATDLKKLSLLIIAVQMLDDALETHLKKTLDESPNLAERFTGFSIPVSIN